MEVQDSINTVIRLEESEAGDLWLAGRTLADICKISASRLKREVVIDGVDETITVNELCRIALILDRIAYTADYRHKDGLILK